MAADDRYIKKRKGTGWPRQTVANIFSEEQEAKLEEYIVNCSRIYYGLTSRDVRLLAYEYAVACKIQYPEKWKGLRNGKRIGCYKKRHPILSLRQPEATSLARATSFNADNVGQFYNNLEEVLRRYKVQGHQGMECGRNGLTTVQKPSKILAEKGKNK
ncbi:hypothetical protein NQ318_013130 [Aromia moschata]|uniref:Uncharacterized protein n=1 Tax=Aromia moschata TaxID=1265417 RepID=A0AAV8Y4R1_9CUCU|nr:hypothetical protein NQ318_013130 [Aromia moschata]